jgi:hypothetical protein
MENDPSPAFTVDRLPVVNEQIRKGAELADVHGSRKEYLEALRTMLQELQSHPIEWGEPRYNTKKQGGVVCQRIHRLLIVHYAVYQDERRVLILDLQVLA